MHQRDFVLRMIEQLGIVLSALRRLILGGGDPEAVGQALTDAASQAGMDIGLLRALSVETLYALVTTTGEVELTRCWLMAELLYLDGLGASLEDRREDARDSLTKARSLYDMVRPAGGLLIGLPEAAGRIEEIDALLVGLAERSTRPDPTRHSRRRALHVPPSLRMRSA